MRIRHPGERHEAAAEQRDEVERAVVGPVEVLDDDDRGGRELVERGGEHVLARARAVERGEERPAGLARPRRGAGPSRAG